MREPARKALGILLFLAVLGLAAWLPALGYSREWNQPTLPLAILVILTFNLVAIRRVAQDDQRLRYLLRAGLV